MLSTPMPEGELERVISLSEHDLDYSNFKDSFKGLTKLAAKVAGTDISLINLIDSYTQWTITNHGIDLDQIPREDSVCQYTIANEDHFEISDLQSDDRFKDKFYVANEPLLRYYYGVPLKTADGHNLGALCVLDKNVKTLTPEKEELLKIIAEEIVNRLNSHRVVTDLKSNIHKANEINKKVAHDIRGPLGGIIGLAQIISEQGHSNEIDEVLEFIELIQRSGRSILELADEILTEGRTQQREIKSDEFNLLIFKDKLDKLYVPQAMNKNIKFLVNISPSSSGLPFSKVKLLQIAGNLISNAIKFTSPNGKVTVGLGFETEDGQNLLKINVEDTGIGLDKPEIDRILNGVKPSTDGTIGEHGYGFGLALVKHLVDTLKGTMQIYSSVGQGTRFEVILPQAL